MNEFVTGTVMMIRCSWFVFGLHFECFDLDLGLDLLSWNTMMSWLNGVKILGLSAFNSTACVFKFYLFWFTGDISAAYSNRSIPSVSNVAAIILQFNLNHERVTNKKITTVRKSKQMFGILVDLVLSWISWSTWKFWPFSINKKLGRLSLSNNVYLATVLSIRNQIAISEECITIDQSSQLSPS